MSRKNLIKVSKEILSRDIGGKTYIITGANSGVGLETTRQLIKQGAHVVMACRRVDAAKKETQSFSALKGSFDVMKLDLANLQSVRDFAGQFLSKYDHLDGLACNAGMVNMTGKRELTKDGLESTIGISYFGHFLLTELLLDLLKKSAPSRILILSSVVHAGSAKNRHDIHFDDLNYDKRKFNAFAAYGEAKLATNLYTLELAKRLEGTGVTTASIHPGWARSNFGKGGGIFISIAFLLMKPFLPFISDSSQEAAQTSLHVLLSDDAPKYSGAYFSQSSILYQDKECKDGGWPMESPNANAKDINKAKKLVEESYKIVGLS